VGVAVSESETTKSTKFTKGKEREDEDGVYDPADVNDRLLLGLKGTMSEAELHVLRARLLPGVEPAADGDYVNQAAYTDYAPQAHRITESASARTRPSRDRT
jgi:hypothetical protein